MSEEPNLLKIDVFKGVFSMPVYVKPSSSTKYWIAILDYDGEIVSYVKKDGAFFSREAFNNCNKFLAKDIHIGDVLLFYAGDKYHKVRFHAHVLDKRSDLIVLERI